MHQLLEVKTYGKAIPFLSEMQEVSGITPFLAPHGLDKETLKVWPILAVFRNSGGTHDCYDTYVTIGLPRASVAHDVSSHYSRARRNLL